MRLPISILPFPTTLPRNRCQEFGVAKSRFPERNRVKLETVIKGFQVAAIDAAASRSYGQFRNELERIG